MSKKSLISIGIPSYNRPEYLKVLLESILAQTYKNFEVIIYDDGSPRIDEIEQIIKNLHDSRVYLFKGENVGFIKNWNRTLLKCQGDYIKIIGDDDLLYPDCLEEQYSIIEENSDIGIVYSNLRAIDSNGKVISNHIFDSNSHRIFKGSKMESGHSFIKNYFLGKRKVGLPGAALFSKNFINQIGLFDESVGSPVDIDYWLRIFHTHSFYYIDKELLSWRWHSNLSKELEKSIQNYSNLVYLLSKHIPVIKNSLTLLETIQIFGIYILLSRKHFRLSNMATLYKEYAKVFKILF